MGLIAAIIAIAIFVLSGIVANVGLLITQPFSSTLVKLRANYRPRRTSPTLEDADAVTASPSKLGPAVNYFTLLFRTKRLEGWTGMYRGIGPSAAANILVHSIVGIFMASGSPWWGTPDYSLTFGKKMVLKFGVVVVSILLLTPLSVIVNRVITHPTTLPWSPRVTLRTVLVPEERAAPWRIYLAPGLVAASIIPSLFMGLLTSSVRHFAVPWLEDLLNSIVPQPDGTFPPANGVALSVPGTVLFVLWIVFSVLVLTPIHCAYIRLSIQRPVSGATSAPAPHNHQATVPVAAADTSAAPHAAPLEKEPVIALRPVDEPLTAADATAQDITSFDASVVPRYTGLLDCIRTMRNEEGLESVYRAVWLTAIGVAVGSLAA